MFFFWLALITATNIDTTKMFDESVCYGPSSMTCSGTFLHFIIAIGMLVGGLIITSQAGGAAGGIAGTGLSRVKKLPGQFRKGATYVPKVASRAAASKLGAMANRSAQRSITAGTAGAPTRLAAIAGSWAHESAESSKSKDAKKMYKRLGNLGMGDNTIQYLRETVRGNRKDGPYNSNERHSNIYTDPRTGQLNSERDTLAGWGGLREAVLGVFNRASDPAIAKRVKNENDLEKLGKAVAAGTTPTATPTPTPAAGTSPSITDRKKYEATKKWKENGSKESEFDENLHYESNKFDMARMTYEPTAEEKEKQKKEAGLSVGKFADGRSNMIGVDFEKLANNHLMGDAKNWNSVPSL